MAAPFPPALLRIFEINAHVGEFAAYSLIGLVALAVLYRLPLFFKHRVFNSRSSQGLILRYQSNPSKQGKNSNPQQSFKPNNSISRFERFEHEIFGKVFGIQVPFTGGLVLGQVMIMIVYMIALIILSVYKNTDPETSITNYRRFGFLALAQIPLSFVLAMKNSPIGSITGQGYEKLNFLHRFIGRMVFVFALVHGALQMRMQTHVRKQFRLHEASLYGFIALCALFVISFTSLKFIRNRVYQFFLLAHIGGYVTAVVTLWMHVPVTHPYLAVAIGAYAVDNLLKIVKTRVKPAKLTALPGGLTRIEVQGVNDGWRAGQHVFIRVLTGRHMFEKHPFTIANAPTSSTPHGSTGHLLLVAKAVGNFTKSLHDLGARNSQGPGSVVEFSEKEKMQYSPQTFDIQDGKLLSAPLVRVLLDGPYGNSFDDMTQYQTVILCAGGSGFTYCMASLEDIVGEAVQAGRNITKHIDIIWALRDAEMLESFSPTVENTIALGRTLNINITFKVFITSPKGMNTNQNILPSTSIEAHSGRPDLFRIVRESIDQQSSSGSDGGGLGIGVCGPLGLVDQMKEVVRGLDKDRFERIGGVKLHSERFGW